MTVSTTRNRINYTGNGSSTVFAFPYKFIATGDIKVYVAGVLQTTGFTVGAPSDTGANVTFSVAPALSAAIVLLSDPAQLQSTSLPSTGPFPAKSVETALDKLTLLIQRASDLIGRSLTLSDGDASTSSLTLPTPVATTMLGWNNTGTAIQNYDAGSLGVAIAYANWSTQRFSGTGVQTAFVLTADAGVASNCDILIGGVGQTAGVDFNYSAPTKTITFTTAPPAGTNNITVRYGQALPQGTIADGSITTAKIADAAVTTVKIADANVTTAKITDANVTPAKLSTGAPTWDSSGKLGINIAPTYQLDVGVPNPTRGVVAELSNTASAGLTGAQLTFLQNTIDWWTIGQPAGVSAFSIWKSRYSANDGIEALRVDNSYNLQFNSGYGSVATAYGCRAWVNFNGSGTVGTNQTIRASGNVTSVFKNSTGDYTVNLTSALPDANYGTAITAEAVTALNRVCYTSDSTAPTTSAYRFTVIQSGSGTADSARIGVAFFR